MRPNRASSPLTNATVGSSPEAYDRLATLVNALPASVRELVNVAGIGPTIALVKAYGGTELIFPKGINPDAQMRYEEIAEVVGYTVADKLAKYGNGIGIYIPRCHAQLTAIRNAELRNDFDQMTLCQVGPQDSSQSNLASLSAREAVSQLARRYRMSSRHVWRLLKAA